MVGSPRTAAQQLCSRTLGRVTSNIKIHTLVPTVPPLWALTAAKARVSEVNLRGRASRHPGWDSQEASIKGWQTLAFQHALWLPEADTLSCFNQWGKTVIVEILLSSPHPHPNPMASHQCRRGGPDQPFRGKETSFRESGWRWVADWEEGQELKGKGPTLSESSRGLNLTFFSLFLSYCSIFIVWATSTQRLNVLI